MTDEDRKSLHAVLEGMTLLSAELVKVLTRLPPTAGNHILPGAAVLTSLSRAQGLLGAMLESEKEGDQ